MKNNGIVIFDGVCNLCSSSVQFIIKRDPDAYFRFISVQDEKAQELIRELKPDIEKIPDSVILIEEGKIYFKSKAVLKIGSRLGFPWNIFSWLRVLPSFLLDPFYSLLAAVRYRIWGKKESCMLPSPELKDRFLN